MSHLCFRTTFSLRTRLGNKRKYLNKRTSKTLIDNKPPILIIDLDYIEELLNKRSASKASNYYKQTNYDLYEFWLSKILNLICPAGIIFIASKSTEFNKIITNPIIITDIKNYIYTLRASHIINDRLTIVSNNLELWLLSSVSANLSFIAIDTNNRLLHYNNKTGLDIVSKFIGTYKIINKLGLAHLKYINLQYLFIVLFYIKITNGNSTEFYFDNNFFKYISNKSFLKSNGLGLELISAAHKFLSYAFLTKPEYLDFFLLGNGDHYELQLTRLLKLLYIDMQILLSLKGSYDKIYKPRLLKIESPNIHSQLPGNLSYYNMIWSNKNTCSLYKDTKNLIKITKKYYRLYNIDLSSIISSFPPSYQKDFKKIVIPSTTKTDTSDIESYITNLISGAF